MLVADAATRAAVRARAADAQDILVVDMPAAAQTHRVYDDYLAELAGTRVTTCRSRRSAWSGRATWSTGS